jgi:hypothetical protein
MDADVAVAGVPDFAVGARPYHPEEPAPTAREMDDPDAHADRQQAAPDYAAADEDDLPPPRPRALPIRQRAYADDEDYAPPRPAYGPPRGWYYQPRPRYRWYPQPYGW